MSDAVEYAGVRLTNPDKVLYPEQDITKAALAEYYQSVADAALPHIRCRPVTIVRCPTGRQKKCFYQRHAKSGVPEQLGQVEIAGFEQSGAYLYLTDVSGLIAMVQMGVLEMHPWGCRIDQTDKPDRLIFDLDPGEATTFADVAAAALELREILLGMGLKPFVKTSGGKGLHVVLPLKRVHSWAQVKTFARSLAEDLAARDPERYLARISKAARRGRIFIDYLRNDPTSTAIAPYSTRARPGAPVAAPLDWSEVTPTLDPASFTIATVPQRLARMGDPWVRMDECGNRLPVTGAAQS